MRKRVRARDENRRKKEISTAVEDLKAGKALHEKGVSAPSHYLAPTCSTRNPPGSTVEGTLHDNM